MPDDLKERYKCLCMSVLFHRAMYYVHARPVISDQEYDALEKSLIAFEAQHPELVHKDSPAGEPGSDNKDDYPLYVTRFADSVMAEI